MARTKSDMLREHREVEKSRTIEEDNIIKKQKEKSIPEDKKSPFPFTRKVDTAETSDLIKASALGDDRNLIDMARVFRTIFQAILSRVLNTRSSYSVGDK